jgi:hypothetical protein
MHSAYGALGTVVGLMLWIYFTAATFLFGAVGHEGQDDLATERKPAIKPER